MRHRDEMHQTSQAHELQGGTTGAETVTETHAAGALTQLMVTQQLLPGRHRAPVATPRIPVQSLPLHDVVAEAAAVVAPAEPETPAEMRPDASERRAAVLAQLSARAAQPESIVIPQVARWKASHLPRTVAAATLAMAAVGTAALGARYSQSRASDDFVSLVIGLGVVVVLWAVVIASTPQVVSLDGSVLTVHNTSGSENFDLADSLQPVDVVGNPRTSHWAVLLHRPNSTTVVLRRNDVAALELDPIVRHFRKVADQRHLERETRFNA